MCYMRYMRYAKYIKDILRFFIINFGVTHVTHEINK